MTQLLTIHRGLDNYLTPLIYVTSCRECSAFHEKLDRTAMPGHLYLQRGKVVLAFARAHHGRSGLAREWVFIEELKRGRWPPEMLREITQLTFDAGLERGGDMTPIIVKALTEREFEQVREGC